MKPELKKLLVLNLPYLLFVYLFAKCGQAYRLAAGVDASAKLLHLTNGISAAFANPLPSLHPFDLCVGVAGAVAVRLIVYSKGKNAKKYRKGEEYGSARWGTAKDIAPYIDSNFENNILLTQTERLTMTGRPKDPKTARNKNVLVIGGSGSGKTRFYVKPNLMQCFPTSDYFKTMGCVAHVMDGQARLEVLHGIFHPDGEPFRFDWDWLAPSGLSTKDFVAPSSLCFGTAKTFGLGGKYGAVSFLQILAPELSDEMLADFLKTESGILVNLHVQAIDQTEAIKTIKRKITDLDAMKIQEQKKAVRSGYDLDILPSDLATYGEDAKKLLNKLQTRNERLFMLTFLVLNVADTKQKLGNDVFQAAGVAQKYNCSLVRLDYQQEQGLVSSLPLGINQIKIQRSLTTSNVAVFVPFVTQELFQSGAAMYYGINAKSHNMIMLDRKQARCPNGLKLGTPGSGKSMSCKSEIVSVFLTTADDIFISDPEAEYYPLVKRLHGQVIKLSPTSRDYVNPLDINLNYSEDDSPLALKSDFVLSFCELVMGGKTGLEAIERTVIDRAVKAIYRPYLANPCPENMPILSDLHQALLDQHLPEADRVAQALDLYVSGSLNVFNHKTNVDIHNRLVAFDIKELGKQLKKLGMLIIQDQIWGRVTQNRSQGRATWYFADEFHLLLKEEQTAAYSAEIWKRFRKWGGVPTGATQNVKDLLSSPEIENILENSDFITLLNQASGDRKILSERLNLSADQQKYIDNSEPGEGLLIFENVVLPFSNPIPNNTQLYKIMTTRLSEVVEL